jgi:hypothetical protein
MIVLARGAAIRYKFYNGPRFNVHGISRKRYSLKKESIS